MKTRAGRPDYNTAGVSVTRRDGIHQTKPNKSGSRNPNRWIRAAAGVAGAALLNAASALPVFADNDIPKVALNVAPAPNEADTGPKVLLGQDASGEGASYAWVDLTTEGEGNCRIYFDFRKSSNSFHFLDRRGTKVALGISEAGVEQILGSGTVAPGAMRLARHGLSMAVFQNGKLVCSGFDERLTGGNAGFRMLGSDAPIKLKAESRDDIHFSDDFMVTETKSAQWRGNGSPEKGDFEVKSLKNPLLSANAFCYMGKGQGIYSVVGEPWWDRYTYQAALRGPAEGAVGISAGTVSKIGLIFAFRDDKNYGLFRWTPRSQVPDAAGVKQAGKRELIRVADGVETVLASSEGGYEPQQWYAATIRVTYAHVNISIDGHSLLDAADPALTSGGAGVWCDVALPAKMALSPKEQAYQYNSLNDLMKQHAVFDDVKVNSLEGFEEQFRLAGPLTGGWLTGAGDWKVQSAKNADGSTTDGGAGELTVIPPADGVAKALIGDRRWARYQVEADVYPGSGPTGLIFLHRDESNYYSATISGDELRLSRVAATSTGIKETNVDTTHLAKSDGPVHLTATIKRGHIKVTASAAGNALVSVETFDGASQLKGRAGLLASGAAAGRSARFSNFELSFVHDSDPLITTNAVFEDEVTMNDWTNPTSEWHPPKDPVMVDGKPVNLLWHRSQFPGDVEMTVEPRDFTETKYEVALSLAKSGQGKNNGYIFLYKSGDSAEGTSRSTTAQIFREGEMVAESVLADDAKQLTSLSLRRCGKYVVATANGTPILTYRDEKPLSGSQIAYYTRGVTLRTEATKISSNNFHDELFSSAPTLWRTAGAAIAEVTNRWQCDPRWSFYSLKSELGKAAPAVLWNKTSYPRDVTVEFFVGNKMEGERGPPYTYARDINVTICSDGSDLTKGYTFMFGGNGNQGSMITRNGVEVKRSAKTVTIPTDMNFHRYWFAIKVEKHGSRVSYKIDKYFADEKNDKGETVGELAFDDPQPLTGDRVGLWTFNHAIMISRIRISGENGEVLEMPGADRPALKSPYDGK